MTYQSFEEWQKSPIQGAIPFPFGVQERCPCYAKPLAECNCRSESVMQTDLSIAQAHLQAAYHAASEAKLGTTHHDLYMAICDAFNACNEALERVNDAPDQ
jgi:hypothetical protein